MDRPDDLVDEDEGDPDDEDVLPSFRRRRDDVRCCPFPGRRTVARKALRDRFGLRG